jgi:hypothetical protein
MVEAAAQGLGVVVAPATEAEGIADVDRAVGARQIERVHRLLVEPRREPLPRGLFPAMRQHVRRQVAAIDVQPRPQQWQQQAPGAAREIEGRLAIVRDAAAVKGHLVG